MRKEERYEKILAHFRKEMPNANTELEFGSGVPVARGRHPQRPMH